MDGGHGEQSHIAAGLWLIGAPLILVVGVLGNLGTIIVFLSPKNKTSSTSVYLVWMAFTELAALVVSLPRWWFIYLLRYDIRHYSNMACKLHYLVQGYAVNASSYILLALTMERLISTIKPHRVKVMCTPKVANVACVFVMCMLVLVSACMMYGYELTHIPMGGGNDALHSNPHSNPHSNGTRCRNEFEYGCNNIDEFGNTNETFYADLSTGMDQTWDTTSPTMFTTHASEGTDAGPGTDGGHASPRLIPVCGWYRGIPYVGIMQQITAIVYFFIGFVAVEAVFIVADVIIVYKLSAYRNARSQMTGSKRKQSDHVRQITITLVTLNLIFIVSKTPLHVYLTFIRGTVNTIANDTHEVIWAVICLVYFTNHAINFILYVLIGERFRNQVKEMFCFWKTENMDNKRKTVNVEHISHPSTNSSSLATLA